jgi:hypothetical protein
MYLTYTVSEMTILYLQRTHFPVTSINVRFGLTVNSCLIFTCIYESAFKASTR